MALIQGQQPGPQVQQVDNILCVGLMPGRPRGQKSVWATAHTAHTVPYEVSLGKLYCSVSLSYDGLFSDRL